ncbi:MAG: diguanylate cyclase, partial [Clostridiales bacterium]|nr:diguanylate cyclase [Clostridiales bacterium]
TRIGELLKVHYRSSDIIGRIGLNQFVVYLKDIHSYKNAYDKAERICKEVEEQFSYEHTKSSLTLSIGVAFHKGGQPDYPILLSNAKEAMEAATKTPGCSFEVYQGMS